MYDAILSFRTDGSVPRGQDIHLFLRFSGSQDYFQHPQIYGWRTQDFRVPGLAQRIVQEEERFEEMREDLAEVREKIGRMKAGEVDMKDLQPKASLEGCVRLPLLSAGVWPARYGFGAHVYPEIADIDTQCERLMKRR